MSHSLTPGIRFLYCIPPHTHALLRYRVQAVTASHVAYFSGSGVAVDKSTGAVLSDAVAGEDGPVRRVRMDRIDKVRSWEGVPPEEPVFYSSVEAFSRLHELALVRYGLSDLPTVWFDDIEDETGHPAPDPALDQLRRRMMDAHPDHGGTEAEFAVARAAFEAARRSRPRRP